MSPIQYARIALLVIVVLLFPAGYLKGCSDEQGRFEDFKKAQAAIAEAQRANTVATIAKQKAAKEAADAENSAAIATLAERVRRARSRPVPAPASCPTDPQGADRYRSEFERAYRDLVAGLREEADRCSKAEVELNTAKRWAQ